MENNQYRGDTNSSNFKYSKEIFNSNFLTVIESKKANRLLMTLFAIGLLVGIFI